MSDYVVYHTNKHGLTGLFVMEESDKEFKSVNTLTVEPILAHSATKVITKRCSYIVSKDGTLMKN